MPPAPLAQPQSYPIPDPDVMQRRVCFVAPFGLGQKTTIWARTLPLAKALTRHGWAATILIPPWDTPADAGKRWLEPGSQASPPALGTVEIVNVQLGGSPLAVTRRLLREIDACQPHIVHIVKPRAYAGLVQWAKWQRRRSLSAPLLLDIDDWEQAWASINCYPWPLARLGAWQEEWGIRHADGITAASRWLVERVGNYAPQTPVLYLPNGVSNVSGVSDPPAAGPRPTGTAGDVLFFSRYVEVPPAWLGAFATSLYAIRPQTRLIVAGAPVQGGLDEPFRRAVGEALAAAGAPADQVQWLGFVTAAEMPALYARCGCAIFPATPTPLQQAKCSVRLATTLLQGLPVVASAVGEQAAYGAEGAARLVPAEASPTAFAAAVDDVLRHPDQQIALAEAARARLLERYAWDKLGTELAEFYTKFV